MRFRIKIITFLIVGVLLTSCASKDIGYTGSTIADNVDGKILDDISLPYSSEISSEDVGIESHISEVILSENKSRFKTSGAESYATEAHDVLTKIEEGNSLKVYLIVLYAQYQEKNDEIVLTGAMCSPVSISFLKKGNEYILDEYWVPEDGESYEQSVRDRFPSDVVEDALALELPDGMAVCDQAAEAYFKGDK